MLDAEWAGIVLRPDDDIEEYSLIACTRHAHPLKSQFDGGVSAPRFVQFLSRHATSATATCELSRVVPELHSTLASLGVRSFVARPLADSPLGAVAFGFAAAQIDAERDSAVDTFQRLCEQALARARRYDAEHEIATALQHSLLPGHLDAIPAVGIGARYRAGQRGTIVGGDWYDVIDLGRGRLALVVGDVVGHGPRAAAAMGQLRIAVRTLSPFLGPAALLEQLDVIVERLPDARIATVAYVVVDASIRQIEWSLAGHLPPLVVRHGVASFLSGGLGAPLAVHRGATRSSRVDDLDGITKVVLYTDGLVEVRQVALDDRLELLRSSIPIDDSAPDVACEAILHAMLNRRTPAADDVAVLCAELPRSPVLDVTVPGRFDQLGSLRRGLRAWFRRVNVSGTVADDALLAVGEACANAVEHGYREDPGPIRLQAHRSGDELIIVVSDHGHWVPPEAASSRGRGLRIIEAAMDSLDVQHDSGGTTITMRRRVDIPESQVARREEYPQELDRIRV